MTWVPYDDQTDFKTEILYAPNLSTTPVWTDFANLGGSVTYNPLVSSTHYIYGFTDYRTNYIYGFRIYGTLKGWNPSGYCMWSFTGLRYDDIGWPLSEASLSYGYLLYSSWQTDSTATCGASAFNEVYNTYTASLSTANYSNMQDYGISEQYYSYNSYIEFRFSAYQFPTGTLAEFDLDFRHLSVSPTFTPFANFLDALSSGSLYALNPALPIFSVADFLNGTKLNQFLGNKLSTTINPFTSLFFSGSMNAIWLGLCSFSFGMFILYFMISMLRRAKQ